MRMATVSKGPENAGATKPLAEPTNPWWQTLRWCGVVFAVFTIWLDVDWILVEGGALSHGDMGASVQAFPTPGSPSPGTIVRLSPGGPMDLAGFKAGDVLAPGDWIA